MDSFFRAIRKDRALDRAVDAFSAEKDRALVYGITGTQKAALLGAAYSASPRPTVVIAAGRETLEQLRTDLGTLLPQATVVELPPQDIITFTAAARSVELAAIRMDVLSRLTRGENVIVLASAEAAVQKVLPRQHFIHNRLTLTSGAMVVREEILASLVRFGYERTDQVESRGQFSVRGGIIDIFAINRPLPLRLELFGDEVDSLREFDPATQRSRDPVSQADILPLSEPERSGEAVSFLSYLAGAATVVFDEPARVREQITKLQKENPDIKRHIFAWPALVAAAQGYNTMYFSLMLQKTPRSRTKRNHQHRRSKG